MSELGLAELSNHWPVFVVVIVCSLVQSLFGVGLLLFGTPLLLTLGYEFESVLTFLLPSSMVISFSQAYQGRSLFKRENLIVVLFGVPFIVLGAWIVLGSGLRINLRPFIGALLLFNALTRLTDSFQKSVQSLLSKGRLFFAAFTGLVHGMTNMGGGLLTILVSSIASSKESSRAYIGLGYLTMVFAQLVTLMFIGKTAWGVLTLVLPIAALGTYFGIGNQLFKRASADVFRHLLTAFMLIFGIFLVFR